MRSARHPLFALALRVGSALVFSTMFMLMKYAGEQGAAIPEIMFWRQAVNLPFILLFLWLSGRLHLLKTSRLSSHGRRAALGMFNMIFVVGSTILLPLAVASSLGFTAPLFAVLITAVVLREHVGPWRWTAVLLGLAGVIIILQPGGDVVAPLGAAMGLTAAFFSTIVNFQIRDLGRTESPLAIAFYFSAFGTALAGLALPFFIMPHEPLVWLVLICIGILGFSGQMLMAASLKHGQVATVMIMDYVSLLGATFYGWLIWDALPPASTWLGAPLIVGAGAVVAWREHRLGRERANSADARPELAA